MKKKRRKKIFLLASSKPKGVFKGGLPKRHWAVRRVAHRSFSWRRASADRGVALWRYRCCVFWLMLSLLCFTLFLLVFVCFVVFHLVFIGFCMFLLCLTLFLLVFVVLISWCMMVLYDDLILFSWSADVLFLWFYGAAPTPALTTQQPTFVKPSPPAAYSGG